MVSHVAVEGVEWRGNRVSRFHNRWNRAACFHVSGTGCAAVEVYKRMRAAMSDGPRAANAIPRQEREIGHSSATFRSGNCQRLRTGLSTLLEPFLLVISSAVLTAT